MPVTSGPMMTMPMPWLWPLAMPANTWSLSMGWRLVNGKATNFLPTIDFSVVEFGHPGFGTIELMFLRKEGFIDVAKGG